MTGKSGPRIFFVDDEPKVRKIVARTLEGLGSRVSCFRCAADCIERLHRKQPDLLITDVKMPEMDGIELLIEAKKLIPWIPVLVVTGYGDIPMAVKAVKAGAVDFIEKPFDRQAFILAVESALKQTTPSDPLLGKSLTRAEVKVLHLILAGKNNREIASLLNRSKRTVEVHRSRIMRKVGADNLVSLVKRATVLGLIEPP
jgi:two-component system response regulator FixJ